MTEKKMNFPTDFFLQNQVLKSAIAMHLLTIYAYLSSMNCLLIILWLVSRETSN